MGSASKPAALSALLRLVGDSGHEVGQLGALDDSEQLVDAAERDAVEFDLWLVTDASERSRQLVERTRVVRESDPFEDLLGLAAGRTGRPINDRAAHGRSIAQDRSLVHARPGVG
jgi:hypothetical protein